MSARRALVALLVACAGVLVGCAAHGPAARPRVPAAESTAPLADSLTRALWHLDENGGTHAADSGPFRLDGVAGLDTRTDFGRFRSARLLHHALDSWVVVPYNPALETPSSFTIEAWVRVDSLSQYEMSVIAARWTPVPGQQEWVLGVTGLNLAPPSIPAAAPGWFRPLTGLAAPLHLVFGYQPVGAGGLHAVQSITELPLGRWVHVAATLDGDVMRLYVAGRLDVTMATTAPMRASDAPLTIGDAFDTRLLTSYGGDLRVDPNTIAHSYYNFTGAIDEVRLSNGARTRFESAP